MAKTNDEIFSLRSLAMDRAQARENLKIDTAATRERLKPSSLVWEAATAAMIAMRRPIARLIASQKKSQPDQIEE